MEKLSDSGLLVCHLTPSVFNRNNSRFIGSVLLQRCNLHDPSTTVYFSPETRMKGLTQKVYNGVYKNKWQQLGDVGSRCAIQLTRCVGLSETQQ